MLFEFKFVKESKLYFKIHWVWDKVPITKVVPNNLIYLLDFSKVFSNLSRYLFKVTNWNSYLIKLLEFLFQCGPPVSLAISLRRAHSPGPFFHADSMPNSVAKRRRPPRPPYPATVQSSASPERRVGRAAARVSSSIGRIASFLHTPSKCFPPLCTAATRSVAMPPPCHQRPKLQARAIAALHVGTVADLHRQPPLRARRSPPSSSAGWVPRSALLPGHAPSRPSPKLNSQHRSRRARCHLASTPSHHCSPRRSMPRRSRATAAPRAPPLVSRSPSPATHRRAGAARAPPLSRSAHPPLLPRSQAFGPYCACGLVRPSRPAGFRA
jgi:hypothetical protein